MQRAIDIVFMKFMHQFCCRLQSGKNRKALLYPKFITNAVCYIENNCIHFPSNQNVWEEINPRVQI